MRSVQVKQLSVFARYLRIFSWCQLSVFRCRIRHIQTWQPMLTTGGAQNFNHWDNAFKIREPEFDTNYLLDPANRDAIRENIAQRKGVGNIDLVVDLCHRMKAETDATKKDELRWQFLKAAANIPNKTHPDSPIGDECEARQVELVGEPRVPRENEPPLKTMVELGERLGMLRTSNVNMTTGHTSYYFLDELAMLERALVRFTVDHLLSLGFELISVPDLLHPDVIESCGFKTTGDVAQVYKLDSSRHDPLCLAGTAEMSLAGFFKDEVLRKEDLPMKVAAVSRCYRAETSHAESDLGIYRVHQFTKVEMFGVTSNDTGTEGNHLLMELIDIEKLLFQQLQLHFRVLDMPTAELGAPANRKFDIESWMPAKQFWGEISSASNCTDYQSRRLNVKYHTDSGQLKHCTTVNGTACAVPRTIMALCETHQNQDGSIMLPAALWKYMNGQQSIHRPDNLTNMTWIKSNKL